MDRREERTNGTARIIRHEDDLSNPWNGEEMVPINRDFSDPF